MAWDQDVGRRSLLWVEVFLAVLAHVKERLARSRQSIQDGWSIEVARNDEGLKGVAEGVVEVEKDGVDVARRSLDQGADSVGVFSFSSKKARTRSTPACWRCSVRVACLRPGNSTAMKPSPSSRRRVSNRVPTAGSFS